MLRKRNNDTAGTSIRKVQRRGLSARSGSRTSHPHRHRGGPPDRVDTCPAPYVPVARVWVRHPAAPTPALSTALESCLFYKLNLLLRDCLLGHDPLRCPGSPRVRGNRHNRNRHPTRNRRIRLIDGRSSPVTPKAKPYAYPQSGGADVHQLNINLSLQIQHKSTPTFHHVLHRCVPCISHVIVFKPQLGQDRRARLEGIGDGFGL